MHRFASVLIVLVAVTALGGAALLATWEIPAPSRTVERVIPDDRFPR